MFRKKTPGLALFLSIKNNQEILKLGLKSFYKHFKKADRVVSHIEFDNGIPEKLGRYPNNLELDWIAWYKKEIEEGSNNRHQLEFSIQLGYADRMLAKIGLGLGVNLFGEAFLKTDCCKMLRDYMWEKDAASREKIGILRHDTFGNKDYILSVLNPEKTDVTIFITLQSNGVILTMNIFGDEQSIAITTDTDLMNSFYKEFNNGIVYTVSPMYDKTAGIYEFMQYIALQNKKSAADCYRSG